MEGSAPLDRVHIALASGTIELPWESRAALLQAMDHLQAFRPVRAKFDAVGTTRPVELRADERRQLLGFLQWWVAQRHTETLRVPAGIYELRDALEADVRAMEGR